MPRAKSWEEYQKECQAVAKEGIKITAFVAPWKGAHTKLVCSCEKHGEWKTATISNFKGGRGCPICGFRRGSRVENDICITEFISTGAFKKGTTFTRSDRLTARGWKGYWYVTCPVCSNDKYVQEGLCSGLFESIGDSLKSGTLPCRCSTAPRYTKSQWEHRLDEECKTRGYKFIGWESKKVGGKAQFTYSCNLHGLQVASSHHFLSDGSGCPRCGNQSQQEGYIHKLTDEVDWSCLKFGIARESKIRIRQQSRSTELFSIKTLAVYKFPTVSACRDAEKECKRTMVCKILTKSQLADGYTETTPIQNLDKIIEIYERFGGVKIS